MSEDSSKSSLVGPPWGWVAALGVSLAAVVAAQLALALVALVFGWGPDGLSQAQTYFLAALAVALPLGVIYLYLKKRGFKPADLGLAARPKPFLKPLIMAFGAYVASTIAVLLLLAALVPAADLDQAQELGLGGSPDAAWEYASLFFLLAVLTPFSEEIIFRGFMLRGLARRFGWRGAAILSSLLFGLAHGQLNVAVDTAIMGWFSASLAIATGSLWPSIALHSLKNTIAYGLVFLTPLVS